MRLSETERIQLRATALDKATRLVATGHCAPAQVFALSQNFSDYMEQGIEPARWDEHDSSLANLMMEDEDGSTEDSSN